MHKTIKITGLILSIFLLIIISYGIFLSDKTVITGIIKKSKKGVEEKDLAKTLLYVSKDYTDELGMTYNLWETFFGNLYTSFDKIKIKLSDLVVDVEGDKGVASFKFKVLISGRHPIKGFYKEDSPVQEIRLIFEKKDKKWLIISSEGLEDYHYIHEFSRIKEDVK